MGLTPTLLYLPQRHNLPQYDNGLPWWIQFSFRVNRISSTFMVTNTHSSNIEMKSRTWGQSRITTRGLRSHINWNVPWMPTSLPQSTLGLPYLQVPAICHLPTTTLEYTPSLSHKYQKYTTVHCIIFPIRYLLPPKPSLSFSQMNKWFFNQADISHILSSTPLHFQ